MRSDAVLRAETAWLEGNDVEAERLLVEERRRSQREGDAAGAIDADLALALFAIAIDDADRARAQLAAVVDGGASDESRVWRWIAEARLSRGTSGDLRRMPALDGLDAAARCAALIEQASARRERGELGAAEASLAEARTSPGTSTSLAALEVETAEVRLVGGDAIGAKEAFLAARASLLSASLHRAEGRVLLRYALAVAPLIAGEEAPAIWLGRAQAALGNAATWRDRAALRAGFRQYGRRLPDSAIVESIALRVDSLERVCATLRGSVAASTDAADRAVGRATLLAPLASRELLSARDAVEQLPGSVAPLVTEVERVGGELIELMGAALVERDRMRTLLHVLADLDLVTDMARYASEAARASARVLDADRVVIAQLGSASEGPRELGVFAPRGAAPADLWQPAVLGSLRAPIETTTSLAPPSLRVEAKPRGPVLVVPIRSRAFTGAVYADKLQRAGQFRDSDHHLGSLLAEYLAQGFGRIVAREAERVALAQLEATLDAIRDGVVAIDDKGVIRSINAAAARMMRISEGSAVGHDMDSVPHLQPLREALRGKQKPDGSVVRLPHGSLVVTSRPIDLAAPSQGGARASGVVATLIELDRAQRLALRISNARPRYGFQDVVGASPEISEALRLCRQAATVDATVLITGESGTGKEVLAQAIHTGGARANEPFVGINCAALPRELLESELFGYERGAFTGARVEGASGKFEQAGEGTLLLDEIGDMPLDMQVKLLRVLQERVVVRVGGSRERPMQARVIATTHRNLEAMVERGTFRLDLLFRLRVLHVHLPPLRDRPSDVEALAAHFLRRVAEAQGKPVRTLGPDVLRSLLSYPWPGNVRELSNVMEREVSLVSTNTHVLDRFEVPLGGAELRAGDTWTPESPTLARIQAVKSVAGAAMMPSEIVPLAEVEKRAFLDALAICNGSVTKAAKELGVSKVTFYAKLRQWGMHPAESSPPSTRRLSAAPETPARGISSTDVTGPATPRSNVRRDRDSLVEAAAPLGATCDRRVASDLGRDGEMQAFHASGSKVAEGRGMPRDPAVPHFLRVVRVLTLATGVALPTMGCGGGDGSGQVADTSQIHVSSAGGDSGQGGFYGSIAAGSPDNRTGAGSGGTPEGGHKTTDYGGSSGGPSAGGAPEGGFCCGAGAGGTPTGQGGFFQGSTGAGSPEGGSTGWMEVGAGSGGVPEGGSTGWMEVGAGSGGVPEGGGTGAGSMESGAGSGGAPEGGATGTGGGWEEGGGAAGAPEGGGGTGDGGASGDTGSAGFCCGVSIGGSPGGGASGVGGSG